MFHQKKIILKIKKNEEKNVAFFKVFFILIHFGFFV